ncbi:MAG: toxin-antitoxin system YwqK family antitoxin [Usitatibacter sp.]
MTRTPLFVLALLALAGCWQKELGRSYYPSGKVRTEATVRNNVLDGPAVMYYENGGKMSEAHYRAGMLSGKSTSYYESGARKAEAEYRDGVLHGTSLSWSKDGTIERTARFDEGRLVSAEGRPGDSTPPPRQEAR